MFKLQGFLLLYGFRKDRDEAIQKPAVYFKKGHYSLVYVVMNFTYVFLSFSASGNAKYLVFHYLSSTSCRTL